MSKYYFHVLCLRFIMFIHFTSTECHWMAHDIVIEKFFFLSRLLLPNSHWCIEKPKHCAGQSSQYRILTKINWKLFLWSFALTINTFSQWIRIGTMQSSTDKPLFWCVLVAPSLSRSLEEQIMLVATIWTLDVSSRLPKTNRNASSIVHAITVLWCQCNSAETTTTTAGS